MTDKKYEEQLKGIDCCQNCTHFSLGMHFDGCPEGWCNQDKLTVHKREDVCDKFIRRNENGKNN